MDLILNDSYTISDVTPSGPFSKNPNFLAGISFSFIDSFSFSDQLFTSQFPFFLLQDNLSFNDGIALNLSNLFLLIETDLIFIDSVVISEVITSLVFNDLLTFVDSASYSRENNPILSDALNVQDNAILFQAGISTFNESYTISDGVTLQLGAQGISLAIADNINIDDLISIQIPNVTLSQLVGDSYTIRDDITEVINSDVLNSYLRRYLNDVVS